MSDRLHRLLHGQTCRGCGTRRRIRWYADTGCCSFICLAGAMARLERDRAGEDGERLLRTLRKQMRIEGGRL